MVEKEPRKPVYGKHMTDKNLAFKLRDQMGSVVETDSMRSVVGGGYENLSTKSSVQPTSMFRSPTINSP